MNFKGIVRSATTFLSLLASSFLIWYSPPLKAQTPTELFIHPELYVEVQDSIFVKRVRGTDTVPVNDFRVAASYQWEMVYDSTCRVSYLFSECRHNEVRPRLTTWVARRLMTAPIEKFNDSSKTESFVVLTGDSVSFYREFRWYNPKNHRQDTNNFYSPDTLDYAVELVNAANGERLTLLDSMGVLPSITPNIPILYGTRPIIALVKYIVPSYMNGKTAFVRIRQYARGDGLYNPVRLDMPTINISKTLDNPDLNSYLQDFGGGLSKRSISQFNTSSSIENGSVVFDVKQITANEIDVAFAPPIQGGSVSVLIYDGLGNLTFIPFTTKFLTRRESIRYQFPSNGTYFITFICNGVISAVRKVSILN